MSMSWKELSSTTARSVSFICRVRGSRGVPMLPPSQTVFPSAFSKYPTASKVSWNAGTAQNRASAGNSAVAALTASEIGDLAEKLVNAQFSQAQETEADDYAFDLLTTAKLKRDGLVTAFEKLAKLGDNSSMLSSHPACQPRRRPARWSSNKRLYRRLDERSRASPGFFLSGWRA